MKKFTLLILAVSLFGCVYLSDASTNKDIITESASPTPTITPSPKPTPLPTPTPSFLLPSGYETYCNLVRCKPIDEKNFKPKLINPLDLVVTKDGQTVYAINKRKSINNYRYIDKDEKFYHCNDKDIQLLDRNFIYEIKSDKSISALRIDGEYPFSCQLSEDIEIDKDDNLYITKPIIDNNNNKVHVYPYLAHEIYKITPDKQMSLYTTTKLEEPETSPSAWPEPRILTNLQITENNEFYYLLRSYSEDSKDVLDRIDSNKNHKRLMEYSKFSGWAIFDFFVKGNDIYINNYKMSIPEKKIYASNIYDFLREKGEKLNKEDLQLGFPSRITVDNLENVYISAPLKNVIWKVTQSGEVIKFAGSGQTGYKDGNALEAQFNFPTAMVFDAQGNMFVADSDNNAIRKITPDGIVSTFYKQEDWVIF